MSKTKFFILSVVLVSICVGYQHLHLLRPAPTVYEGIIFPKEPSEVFVITNDGPSCQVLASPESAAIITEETGPIRVYFDGKTKLFKQRQVFIVEVQSDSVEFLIIDHEKNVQRRILEPPKQPDPPKKEAPPPDPPKAPPEPLILQQFRVAFEKDKDYDRSILIQKLSMIYRQASKVTAPSLIYTTVNDLEAAVRSAAQGQIGVLTLPNTRDAINDWMATQIPSKNTRLTPTLRSQHATAWATVADTLMQLTKGKD